MTPTKFQAQIAALRPDQREYFEHLISSWRGQRRTDWLFTYDRALKKTLNNRP